MSALGRTMSAAGGTLLWSVSGRTLRRNLVLAKTEIGAARQFSTSQTRTAVPPLLFTLAKPIARLLTVILGKGARYWWRGLPAHRKLTLKQFAQLHKKKAFTAGALATGGILYGYESHIQECPITGRRRFVALTPDQAKKIGYFNFRTILEDHQTSLMSIHSPAYDRVVRVVNKVINSNRDLRQIYDKTWTLTVIDEAEENAFVLPSGNIFVYTGMLQACENDDELATVIAHEVAHVVLGHVEEKLTLTSFIQFVLLVPMAVLWAFLPNDGIALVANWFMDTVVDIMVELPFSRDMEMEADRVGLIMAAKACYDVREAPAFWGKLKILSENPQEDKSLEFTSTHPCHETREQTLRNLLSDAIKIRYECGCDRLDQSRDPVKRLAALAAYVHSKRNRAREEPRFV